jgi:hypothetical protein
MLAAFVLWRMQRREPNALFYQVFWRKALLPAPCVNFLAEMAEHRAEPCRALTFAIAGWRPEIHANKRTNQPIRYAIAKISTEALRAVNHVQCKSHFSAF